VHAGAVAGDHAAVGTPAPAAGEQQKEGETGVPHPAASSTAKSEIPFAVTAASLSAGNWS